MRGLACDHPYVDGTKRTATQATDLFLRRNGWMIEVEQDVLVDFVVEVAQGRVDVAGIASWLGARSRKV